MKRQGTPKLELRAPDKRRDGTELVDNIAKTFPVNGYYGMRDYCRARYVLKGNYDWQASRIGLIDGRIVSHYGVWGYEMWIGTVRVRVGGIGAVLTHGDYRKRGLMAKTAPAVVKAMGDAGYDMSVLFGIPDFYHKFGYVRAWSSPAFSTGVDGLPEEKPSGRVRKFKVKHCPERDKLYNRETRYLTGYAIRPTFTTTSAWSDLGYEWRDAKGTLKGYVYLKGERDKLICSEAIGDPEQVLRVLRQAATKLNYREIEFRGIHAESALGRRLRWGNCQERTGHAACAGAMARIINLESLIEKLCPEFSVRLKLNGVKWKGTLVFCFGTERAAVKIDGQQATLDGTYGTNGTNRSNRSVHAVAGGDHLMQLLMGTDEPQSVVAHGKLKLKGDAKFLVPVLCPNRHPDLAEWDRY